MRIWDVNPGYLDRQRLLGEHRELHGLYNVLTLGRQGYAHHPETMRWRNCVAALCLRHAQLVAEMRLRGYRHASPLPTPAGEEIVWPQLWIDPPARQFALLAGKQAAGNSARIPLPRDSEQLWAQHKYSMMAHAPALYARLGRDLAEGRCTNDLPALAERLVRELQQAPAASCLHNALLHMWGYVAGDEAQPTGNQDLLAAIQRLAVSQGRSYLLHSTALSELGAWLPAG